MRHLIAYACTLLIGVAIAHLMLAPPGIGEPPFPHFDKVVHLIAFACLGFPLSVTRTHPALWIFLAAVVYGAAIEIIQPSFGRSAEWADLAADVIGAGLGILLGRLVSRIRKPG